MAGKAPTKWGVDTGSQIEGDEQSEGERTPQKAPEKAREGRLPVPGRNVQDGEGFTREKEPDQDVLAKRQAAAGEDSQEPTPLADSALPMGDKDVVEADPADSQVADYLDDVAQESGWSDRQVKPPTEKKSGKKP